MSMQIHGPSDCLTAKDIHAFVNNPGFIVLNFGPIRFYLDDPQQCDWLIIAATEAKQLLIDNPAKPEDGKPADPPAPDDDDESGEDATVAIAESSAAGRRFPCCEHCTPTCDAFGSHAIPCTTPGCPSTASLTAAGR